MKSPVLCFLTCETYWSWDVVVCNFVFCQLGSLCKTGSLFKFNFEN